MLLQRLPFIRFASRRMLICMEWIQILLEKRVTQQNLRVTLLYKINYNFISFVISILILVRSSLRCRIPGPRPRPMLPIHHPLGTFPYVSSQCKYLGFFHVVSRDGGQCDSLGTCSDPRLPHDGCTHFGNRFSDLSIWACIHLPAQVMHTTPSVGVGTYVWHASKWRKWLISPWTASHVCLVVPFASPCTRRREGDTK